MRFPLNQAPRYRRTTAARAQTADAPALCPARLRAIAAGALALLLGAGCALPGGPGAQERAGARETVYESRSAWIALAPVESGHEPNDHPVRFEHRELVSLLASVQARLGEDRGRGLFSDRGGKRLPLFTEATVEALAAPLADAFAGAAPHQDVLIQVEQSRPQSLVQWLEESRVTTARLFHRDGRLHLMAGVVDIPADDDASSGSGGTAKSADYRAPGTRVVDRAPMASRAGPARATAALSSALGVGGTPSGRPDWLALDTARARADAGGDPAREAAERRPSAPAEAQAPPPRPPQPRQPAAGDAGTEAPPAASLSAAQRQRLRELRALRREDLISESVYESLVRDVLDMEAAGAE